MALSEDFSRKPDLQRGAEIVMITRHTPSTDPKLAVGNYDTVVIEPMDLKDKTLQVKKISDIQKRNCTVLKTCKGNLATLLVDKDLFFESGLHDAFEKVFYDYTHNGGNIEAVIHLKKLIQRSSKYGIQMFFAWKNLAVDTKKSERFKENREMGFTKKLAGKTKKELDIIIGSKKIIESTKQEELEKLAKIYEGLCKRFGSTTDIVEEIIWQSMLLFENVDLPDLSVIGRN